MILICLLETARLKAEIASLDEKIKIAQDEYTEVKAAYEQTKTEYEAIEEKTDEIDDSLERSKRQLNETKLLKQQLEGQIEVLKEQINTARMNDEHLEQRLSAIRESLSERAHNLSSLENEKEEIMKQIEMKAGEDKTAQEQLLRIQTRIAELAGSIDQNKNELFELLTNRSSTKAKIQKFDTMLEQIQVRRSELHQRLITANSEEQKQKELKHQYEEELRSISSTIIGYVDEIKFYESEIDRLQKEISEMTEQLRIGQKAFHREESRLESLKNLTERYDGYGNSIRKVMERKNEVSGIHGVVADLIKVSKEYEIAVETALGGSIQNIVTDNEETAKHMISYLKQNKFGRATFLPLTSMKASESKI